MGIGLAAGFTFGHTVVGVAFVCPAVVTLAIAALAHRFLAARANPDKPRTAWSITLAPVAAVAAVTILLGGVWANMAWYTWSVSITEYEKLFFDQPVSELIAGQLPVELSQRPARSGPPFPVDPTQQENDQAVVWAGWNRSEYSRDPSIGGYVNLRGQPRYDQILELAPQRAAAPLFNTLKLPSTVWRLPAGAKGDPASAACVSTASCLDPGLQVTRWTPSEIEVSVPPGGPSTIVMNEISYRGWTATVCDAQSCTDQSVPVSDDDFLSTAQVPAGTTSVTFTYNTPNMSAAWICFWLGVATSIAAASAVAIVNRRRSREPALSKAGNADAGV